MKSYPERLQQLIGYEPGGRGLGIIDGLRNPMELLQEK